LLVTVTADDLSLRSFYADTKLTLPLSSFDQATAKLSGANPGDKNIPIAIEPDGNLLVTQQGKVLRIWDVKSPGGPELQATISGDVSGGVAFSPDGKTIATAPSVDIVQWWSVDKDQSRPIPYRTLFSQVRAMAFSPDGKILAVGGGSGEETSGLVTLWNAETHQLLAKQIRGHEGVGIDVTSLAFSPANNRILAVGGSDKTVELWDVSTGKLITPPFEGHKLPITSVAYSPDGRTIASADSSGVVNLWSASTYQWMVSLKASANAIRTVAFSENGEILLTEDVKGEIREFRAARREQVD
jgi:WD40 repeat protein